jgi:methionine synthase II (cobalamin-independent)
MSAESTRGERSRAEPPQQFLAVPTVVGSFPHADAAVLLEQIFRRLPQMPAWPQLPARDWRESMYVQYSEGLPGATIDAERQRITFRSGEQLAEELEGFYAAVVGEDVERFAIGRDYALGLHLFLERLRATPVASRPRWVKGQVTGPFSFAMTVTDENKRALAYTPELYEVAVQGMALKARWVARRLRELCDGALVVLDEPYLCSFGSAFVNVAREDVIAAIDGAVSAVHAEGALVGLHCCGNTDWSLVLATGVDVVNFDAHDYFQGLSLYPVELRSFLARGGTLSWGIVPTSRSLDQVSCAALLAKIDEALAVLAGKGLDRDQLLRQMLLTPSCGMGTQTAAGAERVLELLVELAGELRRREGLA